MRLFPEGKSRKLSGVSLAAAAVCAVMAFRAFRDLATLLGVAASPSFLLGMTRAKVPAELPPLAFLMVYHMREFFVLSALFWLSGLALSVGVWARREWARRGACWLLYLLSAVAALLTAYPWLAVPKPLMYGGISLAPDFNSAVRAWAFLTRALAFACGSLCLWGALTLDRGALKNEFAATRS